jgi:hypothetical protein
MTAARFSDLGDPSIEHRVLGLARRLIWTRSVIGLYGNRLFTAISGAGVGYYLGNPDRTTERPGGGHRGNRRPTLTARRGGPCRGRTRAHDLTKLHDSRGRRR